MKKIGLLLPFHYKLLSVAAILDVLETTNRVCEERGEERPFEIVIVQTHGQISEHSNTFHGFPVETILKENQFDCVLIPSFSSGDLGQVIESNKVFIPWILEQAGNGADVCSFCTGAFLLAATGLLNDHAATTHVDAGEAFIRLFPKVHLHLDDVVTESGQVFTSGGSTNTFYLLLFLVEKYCGRETAIRVAKIFSIDMDRTTQSYFGTFQPQHTHGDELVLQVQQEIEQQYKDIATIEDVLKDFPASRRNIVRRFTNATGMPPIEYLQRIRIERAKKLLEKGGRSISEIVYETGYTDPKSFRKVFTKLVGMTPLDYKNKFSRQAAFSDM